MKKSWKLLNKKTVFNKPHAVVERWSFKLPSGGKRDFLMEKGSDFLFVCAQTKAGKFMIIRQYYLNVQKKISSLVAGFVDRGESPLVAAKRELLEESGYAARRWINLGTSIQGKYRTGIVHHFLALEARRVKKQQLEPAEDIDVAEIGAGKFKKMVESGGLADVFAEVCARRALDYLSKHKS